MNEINSNSSNADLVNANPKLTSGASKKAPQNQSNDGPNTQQARTNKDVREAEKTTDSSSLTQANRPEGSEIISDENIEHTVEELNNYVQSLNRSIQFAYDREAGKTVITVTDEDTGKVIRRIPEDLLLELAKKMRDKEPIEMVNLQA